MSDGKDIKSNLLIGSGWKRKEKGGRMEEERKHREFHHERLDSSS